MAHYAKLEQMSLFVNAEIQIRLQEFEFTYVRSSGPGGQNVNKVSSKAVLRWRVNKTQSMGPETLQRVISALSRYINNDSELVLTSDRFRDQTRNREDCLEKLKTLISVACIRPKKRKKTKPSYSSQQKAKNKKKKDSLKKKLRSSRY